jgi:hypothetical protein
MLSRYTNATFSLILVGHESCGESPAKDLSTFMPYPSLGENNAH